MDTTWSPNLKSFDGPKYKALAAALRDGIQQGALPPGMKVPPVRELAWKMGVTPGTVARAYTILTDAGVLEATVGRGTFVAQFAAVPGDGVYADGTQIEIDPTPHGSGGITEELNLLSPALPNVGQAELIKRLMGEVAQNPPSGIMHYPTRRAFRPAREAVVRWLEGTPLGALDQDNIVLSHGGQNGICLALQAILRGPNPTVLIEDLAYPGFRRAAELLRAQPVPVPIDEHGLIPEALEQMIQSTGAQALCTSPEVHNPTTIFTPEERRREIAAICDRYKVDIIEDDCYRMGLARAPTYRMLTPERGWYVSSISKTLTPALRVGFVAAPRQQSSKLRKVAEDGFFGLALPLADLTAKLLVHPQVDRLCVAVNARVLEYTQAAVNALGHHDLRWRRDVPFMWLVLPDGWRASAFCQAAASQAIRLRPADDFAPRDRHAPHAVRVVVNAQVPLERFEEAMQDLRHILDNPPERLGV